MMESVALGDSHMVEVDYVFIERDMDVVDESTYDHCEDAEFFILRSDSSPVLSTVESGSLVSASETGDTSNCFDGEAASGATIVSEDEDGFDEHGLIDMMLESEDTTDRPPVELTPSTSITKPQIAEYQDAASVARIEMGSSVELLQTSEPNQNSKAPPEQDTDEVCVMVKGSRKSNKKRRKRMKKLKKEAAAAAAAAALSEIKSSERWTRDEAAAKGKRSKSKNLNKHHNIAVACATETLVTFRETHQEKERKRVSVATRYVC